MTPATLVTNRDEIKPASSGLVYKRPAAVLRMLAVTENDGPEELIGAGLNELDPFTDSSEAVTVWEEGSYEPLITHNVADIRRTRALMELAEQYCSKSDFSMKSLEPIS